MLSRFVRHNGALFELGNVLCRRVCSVGTKVHPLTLKMNINKYTIKSQEALQSAIELARKAWQSGH